MFDIGWSELVVVGLVALIVIGPKELPTVLRTAGQWMGKVKRMASEFQGQFQEALREAEVADLKQHADDLTGELKSITEFDPMADDTSKTEEDSTDWDEPPYETPEHEEPAAESSAEVTAEHEPAGDSEPKPEPVTAAPVAAVESAPAAELADAAGAAKTEDLTPAETPPPKQARGSA